MKESLQIWINIVEIEPVIGIPPDMTDVLEISWESNVFFLDLPLVTLLGCWSVGAGTKQRILTTSTRVCTGSDSTIDNAIGGGHRTIAVVVVLPPGCLSPLSSHLPLRKLRVDSCLECCSFILISKVQTNLRLISFKCVKIWPGSFVP